MSRETRVALDFVPDLGRSLGPLSLGRRDPTAAIGLGGVWKAMRTPDGPATVHLRVDRLEPNVVAARAWGPGAAWILGRAAGWVGAYDDVDGFDPSAHPVVARAAHLHHGLRVPRTERVLDVLVPTILAQKVTGLEAKRSWAFLVRRRGDRAPGPAGLLLPPEPRWLAELPDHVFHRANVERRRAATIRAAARHAARLEEAVVLGLDVLRARLAAVPGIGPWTVAEVTYVAAGDADAVSVGDYHLPHAVTWALAGEPRGDDARMLELLAPFAPHRGRVARLIELTGGAPRYGPRLEAKSIVGL